MFPKECSPTCTNWPGNQMDAEKVKVVIRNV